jgi:hypothetical protein
MSSVVAEAIAAEGTAADTKATAAATEVAETEAAAAGCASILGPYLLLENMQAHQVSCCDS